MVEKLLRQVNKGPLWKFHALLKVLYEKNQHHVIAWLGLDPKEYADFPEEQVSDPKVCICLNMHSRQ